jgi:hypothetical protein
MFLRISLASYTEENRDVNNDRGGTLKPQPVTFVCVNAESWLVTTARHRSKSFTFIIAMLINGNVFVRQTSFHLQHRAGNAVLTATYHTQCKFSLIRLVEFIFRKEAERGRCKFIYNLVADKQ